MAKDLVKAKQAGVAEGEGVKQGVDASAATCPFAHAEGAKNPHVAQKAFDYEGFYAAELEKKHKDKSYRYFNNINRLANEFPVAHTSSPEDKVTVWCANDYLGMGKSPVVLNTMQFVSFFPVIVLVFSVLTCIV